jgi:hypothetical protein
MGKLIVYFSFSLITTFVVTKTLVSPNIPNLNLFSFKGPNLLVEESWFESIWGKDYTIKITSSEKNPINIVSVIVNGEQELDNADTKNVWMQAKNPKLPVTVTIGDTLSFGLPLDYHKTPVSVDVRTSRGNVHQEFSGETTTFMHTED